MRLTCYETGGALTPHVREWITRALASAVLDLCSGMVREQKAARFIFGFPKAVDR